MTAEAEIRVFLSYRRADARAIARAIRQELVAKLSVDRVFFDIDSIPVGVDFPTHLEAQLSQCNVVLAIIGDRWTTVDGAFAEGDFVRLEIATALALGIPTIPVFAEGAKAPPGASLPEDVRPLLRRQGVAVDSGRTFERDIAGLLQHVQGLATRHEAERAAREASERAARDASSSRPASAAQHAKYRVLERRLEDDVLEFFNGEVVGVDGFTKKVLISRILPALAEAEGLAENYEFASRIAGALTHGNILSIIDRGIADGIVFCVYDYLDFVTLREALADGPLSTSVACFVAKEVCRALQYARTAEYQGRPLALAHDALSAERVFLTRDGRAVVTSFGMSKAFARRGTTSTGRSDLFALGILLLEMLSGTRLDKDGQEQAATLATAGELGARLRARLKYRGELDDVVTALLTNGPGSDLDTRQAATLLQSALRATGEYAGPEEITEVYDQSASRLAAQRKARSSRGSIIGTLIDEALIEFESLDDGPNNAGQTTDPP